MRNTRPLLFALLRESCILPLRTWLAQGRAGSVVSLHAKTSGEDELTDSGAEAAQEGVEGLRSSKSDISGCIHSGPEPSQHSWASTEVELT